MAFGQQSDPLGSLGEWWMWECPPKQTKGLVEVGITDKGFGRRWGGRWQFIHTNKKLRSSSVGNVCRVFKKSLKHLAKPLNFSDLVIPLLGIEPKEIILQME